jgi:hypothetical protein
VLNTEDYVRLYTIEQRVIEKQTAGLTHDDSLLQPHPSGNCMNWVLGHALENQLAILRLLGREPPMDPAVLARYERDTEPIRGEGEGVLPLELLLAYHRTVSDYISARLAQMNDADFAQEITRGDRTSTVGWWFLFLHFHYTYHLGQLEYLRQLAGKTEKVI